jgi:hypothetical protein
MRPFRIVETSSIVEAKFNAPQRTEARGLKSLMADIEKRGVIVPVVIGRGMILADGHRRLACVKALGIETIPAMVYDIPAEELYTINQTQRKLSSGEWFSAYAAGFPIEGVGPKNRANITEIERLIGRGDMCKMAARGRSPNIVSTAKRAALYCGDPSDAFTAECLRWLDECGQQFAVRKAIERTPSIPVEMLREAIKARRSLVFGWIVD